MQATLSTQGIYSVQQHRELDAYTVKHTNVSSFELMQRAAQAAFSVLQTRWPASQHIVIVCGPGNNGGDGFLLGVCALQAGLEVCVVALSEHLEGDAGLAQQAYLDMGGRLLSELDTDVLEKADVVVDALFGSGLNRAVQGRAARWIKAINTCQAKVLALDVPSGLDGDSGQLYGQAIKAQVTVCLLAWKRGLFMSGSANYAGDLRLGKLDLPAYVFASQSTHFNYLHKVQWASRQADSHKGHYGHVLALGGDTGMGGAVLLTASAALRGGAGLVSVATRQIHVAALLSRFPELMVKPVDNMNVVDALITKASVLAVGPGLGQQAWGDALFAKAMQSQLPMVLDADGLNLLARKPVRFTHRDVVLTPHPGEAARLLDTDIKTIEYDRLGSAIRLAKYYRAIVVLKGTYSLIAHPDGRVMTCHRGNPGMATGGMGDVLTGVVAALLAQHFDPWQAANIAVYWHVNAGNHAAKTYGERSLLAHDVVNCMALVAL